MLLVKMMAPLFYSKHKGFTLIEVLIALAIVAIALTTLLKVNAENVNVMTRLKEKTISHWIANQAIEAIQLGLIQIHLNQESSHVTTMLGQKWYWRSKILSTSNSHIDKIVITLSKNRAGPFQDPVIGFKYSP